MSDETDGPAGAPDWSGQGGVAPAADEVVERKSFLQTLMASLVAVVIGLILVGGCAYALFWNEGRAVSLARALTEGAGLAASVSAQRVDPALEGRLVHIAGDARGARLEDRELGVAAQGLRLVRRVEMYQWDETRRTETRNGERITVYRYDREWSERPIDSGRFRQALGHQNPPMPLEGRTLHAAARIEAFTLSPEATARLPSSAEQALPVPESALRAAGERFGGRASIVDGRIYVGTPQEPRVGDLRISYRLVPDGPVSAVGRQDGTGLAPYRASNGRELLLVRAGRHDAGAMFDVAQHDNAVLTWVIRAAGLVLMWIGFALIFRPFVALVEWIPLVGAVMEAGVAAVALLLTLLLGVPVIALAWLTARPLLAAALIAGGIAALFGLRALAERRLARRLAAAPRPARSASVPFIPPHMLPPAGGTR